MIEIVKKILFEGPLTLGKAKTYQEEAKAILDMTRPLIPPMKRTGAKIFPPPHTSKDDISLIVCNHLADVDMWLIMAKMTWHEKTEFPIQFTCFTYNSFQHLPYYGEYVGRSMIGLEQGEPDQDIELKISFLMEEGFNTWLIFPEGTLFDKNKYAKSLAFQKQLKIPEKDWFHHVLYPRTRALNAFLRVAASLKKRLVHIVDLTLEFHGSNSKAMDRTSLHYSYPSTLAGVFDNLRKPSMHVHIYNVSENAQKEIYSEAAAVAEAAAQGAPSASSENPPVPLWLLNLWTIKEKTLKKKENRRKHKKRYDSKSAD